MKRRDLIIGGGALALAGSAEAACATDRRDRRVNRMRGDCGEGVVPLPPIPSGAIIALQSGDVSGSNGDTIATWTNNGTIANFTQSAADKKPKLLVNSAERAVNFDGVFDILTSTGSAAATGFVQSTGVFDLILCFRRTSTSMGSERRICGNCEGQAGIAVLLNTSLNTEGTLWVILSNGGGLLTNWRTGVLAPLGEPFKVLIRGDGTKTQISTNFTSFTDNAWGAGLGAGSAFYDFSVGGSNPSQSTPLTFDGDFYDVLLYDRNLSAGELTEVQTYLTAQVGSGI